MLCSKCGSELPDGAGFCETCGAEQETSANEVKALDEESKEEINGNDFTWDDASSQQPEVPDAGQNQQPESPDAGQKKKKLLRKALFAVVLLLVLIPGVTVLGYYTFLPAKTTLAVAEYFSFIRGYDTFDKNLSLYEERFLKPIYEDSIRKESKLSLSLDPAQLEQLGLPSESVVPAVDFLNSMRFKYGYAMDARNKKQTAYLALDFKDKSLLSANVFMENTAFGLASPELTEKTITGDLKKLDKLTEVYPDMDPALLETYKNMDPWAQVRIYEETKVDRKKMKKLMGDYAKELVNSVNPKDMSIRRGQKTEVLDKELTCQEVTVKLDREAQRKILSDILSKLQKDQNAFDLTVGKFNELMEILGENRLYEQMFAEMGLKVPVSKENFTKALSDWNSSIDVEALPEEITVKIYIQGLNFVKYEFAVKSETDSENILYTIETITDGLSCDGKYTLTGSDGMANGSAVLSLSSDYDKKTDTTDFYLELVTDISTNNEPFKMNLTVDSKETPDGDGIKHKLDGSLSFDTYTNGSQEKGKFTLSLDGRNIRNSRKLVIESSYKGAIGFEIPEVTSQPLNIGFTLDENTYYGKGVEIPQISQENKLDISTAEQKDYENLVNEIYENMSNVLTAFGTM